MVVLVDGYICSVVVFCVVCLNLVCCDWLLFVYSGVELGYWYVFEVLVV